MAKENYISLRGQLRNEVSFIKDPNTGLDKLAMFTLYVIRRSTRDRAGNLTPKFDKPIIMTADQEMINMAKKLELHDIVEIKGTFRTGFTKGHRQCPHCGKIHQIELGLQTINPSFIGALVHLNNDTEGLSYLVDTAEISNVAKVMGRVCTATDNIVTAETDRGNLYSRYQLAVNRKLFIKGTNDYEDHTDYPLVYSYDDTAYQDSLVLKQGTLLYLDGFVHTMKIDQVLNCDECGNDFSFETQRMNLTPYSNEYLRDYDMDAIESTHPVNEEEQALDNERENGD